MSIDKSPTDIFFHDQTKKSLAADYLTKVDLSLPYQEISKYLRERLEKGDGLDGHRPQKVVAPFTAI